jgi:signal-transduction protein with cAMP-binding, CBS, and nucleotidyltransferase domain
MNLFDGPVSAYMSQPPYTISVDAEVSEAEARLRELRVSSLLAVGKDGAPAGVLSRVDLLRAGTVLALGREVLLRLPTCCVGDLMSHPVKHVARDTSIREAARQMLAGGVHRLYVLDGDRAVGVFSTRDVMLAVRDAKLLTPLVEVMSSPVVSVAVSSRADEATAKLTDKRISGVVVVEDDHPVGLYTQTEALLAKDLPRDTTVEAVMTQALLCLSTTVPLHRAAGFTVSTQARRVVVVQHHHHHHEMRGIVTGMDFVRIVANGPGSPTAVAAG